MPPVALDRASPCPLHRQLYEAVAQAVRAGEIGRDSRLPSSRMMAKLLGVSRNTVLTAYETLAADGLILGKPGVGMRVIGRSFLSPPRILREARYPEHTVSVADPDGNAVCLNF
ncbi:MAG: GntR family transcriptional regulator [Bryobacteraceae bacterium]